MKGYNLIKQQYSTQVKENNELRNKLTDFQKTLLDNKEKMPVDHQSWALKEIADILKY